MSDNTLDKDNRFFSCPHKAEDCYYKGVKILLYNQRTSLKPGSRSMIHWGCDKKTEGTAISLRGYALKRPACAPQMYPRGLTAEPAESGFLFSCLFFLLPTAAKNPGLPALLSHSQTRTEASLTFFQSPFLIFFKSIKQKLCKGDLCLLWQ